MYSQEILLCKELLEEKELGIMSQGETDHYLFVNYTNNCFRSLEGLPDTEHNLRN